MSLEDSKDSVMLNEEGLGVALPGAQMNLSAQVPLTSDNLKHKWRHCENTSCGSSQSISIFPVTSKSNLSLPIKTDITVLLMGTTQHFEEVWL